MPLNATSVAKQTKAGLYGDGGHLYLKVTPTGTKSWVFRYSVPGSGVQRKRHALGLGPYPDISLAEARELAYQERRRRLAGVDPMAEKRATIAAQRVAAAKEMTFSDCAVAYIKAHEAGWRGDREARQWNSSLRDYVYPIVGKLPVAAIDTALVTKVLEPIWTTKPETASRVRQRVESILGWATVREYRQGDNPARWRGHLENLLPAISKVAKVEHHAALPYGEVGAFMVELRSENSIAARALEFAILTATRVGEVTGATWGEIDFKGRMFTIPADRMKSGREHRVPLGDAALALLTALPHTGDKVFSTGYVSLWRVTKKMRPGITVHGFRSTFRDWAGDMTAFPREVVERCLAHTIGDETEAAYRRGDALEKRRQVMQAWARYCDQRAPAGGEVVPIRA